jgi:toxin ParE1/3/4
MRLKVTRLAQTDVDQAHDFIARDNRPAAIRWVGRTREQFKFRAMNPGAGESRDELRPGLRSYSHGSYVVYFIPHDDVLEVIRVIHGRRDTRMLF